ncbi:MAG: hypothetical protein H0U71_04215 [Gammaproteobacteria bacterium]|nr:hypothetical protein [Gammaproteobacteria bacterium]
MTTSKTEHPNVSLISKVNASSEEKVFNALTMLMDDSLTEESADAVSNKKSLKKYFSNFPDSFVEGIKLLLQEDIKLLTPQKSPTSDDSIIPPGVPILSAEKYLEKKTKIINYLLNFFVELKINFAALPVNVLEGYHAILGLFGNYIYQKEMDDDTIESCKNALMCFMLSGIEHNAPLKKSCYMRLAGIELGMPTNFDIETLAKESPEAFIKLYSQLTDIMELDLSHANYQFECLKLHTFAAIAHSAIAQHGLAQQANSHAIKTLHRLLETPNVLAHQIIAFAKSHFIDNFDVEVFIAHYYLTQKHPQGINAIIRAKQLYNLKQDDKYQQVSVHLLSYLLVTSSDPTFYGEGIKLIMTHQQSSLVYLERRLGNDLISDGKLTLAKIYFALSNANNSQNLAKEYLERATELCTVLIEKDGSAVAHYLLYQINKSLGNVGLYELFAGALGVNEALQELTTLAEGGDSKARCWLGVVYRHKGRENPANYAIAAAHLIQSNTDYAQYCLAEMIYEKKVEHAVDLLTLLEKTLRSPLDFVRDQSLELLEKCTMDKTSPYYARACLVLAETLQSTIKSLSNDREKFLASLKAAKYFSLYHDTHPADYTPFVTPLIDPLISNNFMPSNYLDLFLKTYSQANLKDTYTADNLKFIAAKLHAQAICCDRIYPALLSNEALRGHLTDAQRITALHATVGHFDNDQHSMLLTTFLQETVDPKPYEDWLILNSLVLCHMVQKCPLLNNNEAWIKFLNTTKVIEILKDNELLPNENNNNNYMSKSRTHFFKHSGNIRPEPLQHVSYINRKLYIAGLLFDRRSSLNENNESNLEEKLTTLKILTETFNQVTNIDELNVFTKLLANYPEFESELGKPTSPPQP